MTPRPISCRSWLQAGGFAAASLLVLTAAVAWPTDASPLAVVYPTWTSPEAAYAAALAIPGWRPMRARAGLFPVVLLAPEPGASVAVAWRSGHALAVIGARDAYGCDPGAAGS